MNNPDSRLPRRDFLKAATAAAIAPAIAEALAPGPQKPARMIGIQVGAVSFFDEGVEQVLDIFQERGAINTIFLTTFTYGRGFSGQPWSATTANPTTLMAFCFSTSEMAHCSMPLAQATPKASPRAG